MKQMRAQTGFPLPSSQPGAVSYFKPDRDRLDRELYLGPGSFVLDLEANDLALLRAITRRAHGGRLTDFECDAIIESYGPDAAVDVVRRAVNGRP